MRYVSAIILLFFCMNHGFSQQQPDSTQIWLAQYNALLAGFHLDTLPGEMSALYSKNYESRARTIDVLLENCGRYYEELFPGIKFTAQILILDSSAWNSIGRELPDMPPYGMPNAHWQFNKILISADKRAVAQLFGQTDTLSDNVLSDYDYIALHELGHIFLLGYQKTSTHKKWGDEFLATYFAICYMKQLNTTITLPRVDMMSGYQPEHKTLEDFERLYEGVGPINYAWYQGKFQTLGLSLYPKLKVRLIREFITNYSTNGKQLDPLDLLRNLAPQETNQWLAGMK